MGEPASIHFINPSDSVSRAYQALTTDKTFRERPGQMHLSRAVKQTIENAGVLCAEAATGTGKTIAYLVGAILGAKDSELPIVISTATVALQQQVINHDIPRMIKAGFIEKKDVSIAKGRGRYFCIQAGGRVAAADYSASRQTDMFAPAAQQQQEIKGQEVIAQMLDKFNKGEWDGEQDSWEGKIPPAWDLAKASSETCTGKRCPHYDNCPFFKDRRRMSQARIVVANHNMVLADLAMRAEGIKPLFPFEQYAVIFDEGHHLPEIAASSAEKGSGLQSPIEWLEKLPMFASDLMKPAYIARQLRDLSVTFRDYDTKALCDALKVLSGRVSAYEIPEYKTLRLPEGALPDELRPIAEQAVQEAARVSNLMKKTLQVIKKTAEDVEQSHPEFPRIMQFLVNGSVINSRASDLQKALSGFTFGEKLVRWIEHGRYEYLIHSAPIEGNEVLQNLLWGKGLPVIIVSATLRSLGTFDRYKARAGLPGSTRFEVLPYIFPYDRSKLYLPRMRNTPKENGYEMELAEKIDKRTNREEGTLILFTSKSTMRRVVALLPEDLRKMCLVQFTKSMESLLTTHKQWIDKGVGSVLVGVDSFAEGLDLPGAYCEHVIITRLPFAVPDSPVEDARKEKAGERYFADYSLPDASVKLTQGVGRLLRRESDIGRITVFDTRLRDTNFGRKLLTNLPPFTVVRE